MCPEPIQTLKSEPTSQQRGATSNSLEDTKVTPALSPERDPRPRQSETPTLDNSTAVEGKTTPENRSTNLSTASTLSVSKFVHSQR
jgi:hypothetical protein